MAVLSVNSKNDLTILLRLFCHFSFNQCFFNYYWKYVIKPDNYINNNNNNNDVVVVGIMERNLYNLKLKKKKPSRGRY